MTEPYNKNLYERYLELLQCNNNDSIEIITKKYKFFVAICHPDKYQQNKEFKELSESALKQYNTAYNYIKIYHNLYHNNVNSRSGKHFTNDFTKHTNTSKYINIPFIIIIILLCTKYTNINSIKIDNNKNKIFLTQEQKHENKQTNHNPLKQLISSIYTKMGKESLLVNQYEKALNYFNMAIDMDNKNAYAYYYQYKFLYKTHKIEKAEYALQKAHDLFLEQNDHEGIMLTTKEINEILYLYGNL